MSETKDGIRDQAIAWVIAQETGLDGAETAELREWLEANPEHAEEFELCRDLYRSPELAAGLDIELLQVQPAREPGPAARHTTGVSRYWPALATGIAIAASALLAVLVLPRDAVAPLAETEAVVFARTGYTTELGERREIELPDGSVIQLNADSAVQVSYSPGARTVMLERGEAFFDVARDYQRPFEVFAGSQTVRVLGTAFNIDRQSEVFELSVFEGRVQLFDDATDEAPVFTRDTRVTQHADGNRLVEALSGDPAPDWTSGWLETYSMSIPRLAEELQRYSDKQIELDPSLQQLAITGRFRLDTPREVLTNLAVLYDLELIETETSIRIESRR